MSVPAIARGAESDWDFFAFRIPDHRWYAIQLAGGASASRDQYSAPGPDREFRFGSGNFTGSAVWVRDGERYQNFFSVTARTFVREEWADTWDEGSIPPSTFQTRQNSERRFVNNLAEVREEIRWYPFSVPLGIATQATAGYGDVHNDSEEGSTTTSSDPVSSQRIEFSSARDVRNRQLALAWSVTPLFGRVRDATAVYSGYLLEQRLIRDGILARPLSTAGRERLLSLFYVQNPYGVVHDFPDKFFWQEVERLLREEGALGEAGFDAYALLHALQPAGPDRFVLRRAGYAVGPTLRVDYTDASLQSSQFTHQVTVVDTTRTETSIQVSDDRRDSNTDLLAGGTAEAHVPLGPRWQLDGAVSALFDTEDPQDHQNIDGFGAFTWIVAERWQADASASYFRSYAPQIDYWSASARVNLSYFLEDHLRLGIGFTTGQFHNDYATGEETFSRSSGLMISLSYRFAGLDVPGLVSPVRPMQPGPGY
jgi:hypothetical protein